MNALPYPHNLYVAGGVIAIILLAIVIESRAMRRKRLHQRRKPVQVLLTDAHQCMAHSHWRTLQAKRKARAKAVAAGPFSKAALENSLGRDAETFGGRRRP